MNDSLKFSKASWIITIIVIIGNLVLGRLSLSGIGYVLWGTVVLILLIVGIVFSIKGMKGGKRNNIKSAIIQGRIGTFLNRIILLIFILGAGVASLNQKSKSSWTEGNIKSVKDGCLMLGQSQEFCGCYTNEIIARVSPSEFNELADNRNNSEADYNKAKEFIDSVVEQCNEYKE